MTTHRPPRPKLTPERRAQIRAALQQGKKPLAVCVELGAAYATVLRVQREVRKGLNEERS